MRPSDQRILRYENLTGSRLIRHLGTGAGQDGWVFELSDATGAKFYDRQDRFQRELEVYTALAAKKIRRIAGHNVPELIDFHDELLVIEMTLVVPPFLLDFAGAKLPHEVPDFPEEVMQEHHLRLQELFGKNWIAALDVAEAFRIETGYVMMDIHPGNIAFGRE